MLLHALVGAIASICAVAQQQPLGESSAGAADVRVRSGNFVFNALSGLLKQLPNTIHPNGHTIVPAVIRAHTRLYHAFPSVRDMPCRTEWLAFDEEMSYGIMASAPWNFTLWSYVSNRDLRVLYFDGMSAQLGDTGMLDSQEVFIARRGGVHVGEKWENDAARLHALCDWAQTKGIDGFIRANTAFEIMYCSFQNGIDLVSKLNVTPPDTVKQDFGRHPAIDNCLDPNLPSLARYVSSFPHGDNLGGLATAPPGMPQPKNPITRSPLALGLKFEWLRAAVRRYHRPQPNVRIISSGMATFYDPALTSLVPVWSGKPMAFHRVWNNISRADANTFVDQVEDVLRRPDLWTKHDDISWSSIADQVVEAWSDRIAQINYTLHNPGRNTSSTFRHVQLLAYTLLNPYIDTTGLPHINGSDPALWLPQTLNRCAASYTPFIEDDLLTSTERLLKSSIETVLDRLCHYAGDVLAASFENIPKDELITSWKEATAALMAWLDWATWVRCQPECDPEALCALAAWPILPPVFGDHGIIPQCVSFEQYTQPWSGWI